MLQDPLPYSQACENNKFAILKVLQRYISSEGSLLEIASGTGQHGEFFAQKFPRLRWQTSDIPSAVARLNLRISSSNLPNLPLAIPLDVNELDSCATGYNFLFTANSLHIMSEKSVENFFIGTPAVLLNPGLLFIYGPFKYSGEFTTESNAQFDTWLKERDPDSGVRDLESINALAALAGLNLIEDFQMPANNQLLVFSNSQYEVTAS